MIKKIIKELKKETTDKILISKKINSNDYSLILKQKKDKIIYKISIETYFEKEEIEIETKIKEIEKKEFNLNNLGKLEKIIINKNDYIMKITNDKEVKLL